MSTLLADAVRMPADKRERIDLRAPAEWIARVEAMADRWQMNVSAYIRQAVTRQLEREEAEMAAQEAERNRNR